MGWGRQLLVAFTTLVVVVGAAVPAGAGPIPPPAPPTREGGLYAEFTTSRFVCVVWVQPVLRVSGLWCIPKARMPKSLMKPRKEHSIGLDVTERGA